MITPLKAVKGYKLRAGDGSGERGVPEMLSTAHFYRARSEDKLILLDRRYKFNVATYDARIEDKWVYTYDYAPDQAWVVYNHDLSGGSYRQDEYVFKKDTYFRVCLRKTDGTDFNGSEDINGILAFETVPETKHETKPWIITEAKRVANIVKGIRKPGGLIFALLTDTHYTVNGTWEDTAESILQAHKAIGFDGVIHLGDFTDGSVPSEVTRDYVSGMFEDLNKCNAPVWPVLGNHDSNYFRGNPDRLSLPEQSRLYLGLDSPRYYVDFKDSKLKLIFIDSYDQEESLRYGYSLRCINWLDKTLKETDKNWKVIIFSHLPPVTELQYWSNAVRGSEEIKALLTKRRDKILSWINGHNHADMLSNDCAVPVVSIVNAKCESFFEHKPDGFVTPERRLGEVSQEAWDVLVINPDEGKLRFVRYGSGKNRAVANGRAEWL